MYGSFLFQTNDGQDFYYANLLDVKAFHFIQAEIERIPLIKKKSAFKVLSLVADQPQGKRFTPNYPVCPRCQTRLLFHSNDESKKTGVRYFKYATWKKFESLSDEEKLERIKNALNIR